MNQGFTLIELLVVVLIVGILSAVALPQYQTAVERSRATEALTLMTAIRESMERYHSQREAWPTSFEQLDVDIPQNAECEDTTPAGFGGKNFCVGFSGSNITAVRRRANHTYSLTTAITENANGTYSFTRSCNADASDSEATAYCNAISGGKSANF